MSIRAGSLPESRTIAARGSLSASGGREREWHE